jgi:hypothetical protein
MIPLTDFGQGLVLGVFIGEFIGLLTMALLVMAKERPGRAP